MTLVNGSRLGAYEILGTIGAGGMGEVYRARDTKLGREVAIKVLPEALTSDPERLGRFEREAKLLASLNHPNIAAIYGFEDSGGAPALVMELVPGPTLAERIAEGPVPLDEALPVARQIAEGLEYAHEHGIIHRDLKPANVKVTTDGIVKILDFGLAKALQEEIVPSDLSMSPTLTGMATQAGFLLGTAAYMSPEQAKGKPVDRRADIWAFGCLLYEMLSGASSFAGETVTDLLAAVVRDDPDWSKLPAETPASIRELLAKCLAKDARRRLRDIGDARITLEDTLAGVSEARARSKPAPTVEGGVERPARQRALPWVIAAVLALALAGLGAWSWFGRSEKSVPIQLTFVQKTFQRQTIFNARFLPDGESIVYSASLDGSTPQLFIVRPEYPEPQPLGLADTHLLSISSKGELAVLSHARWLNHRLFEGTLGRVPLGSSAPRDLMDHVREADWSPDGAELAIIHDVGGRDRLEFPIGKVLYESSGYLSDPRVSPDGELVAFMEHPLRFDDRGSVDVVDLSGHRRILSSGFSGEEGLSWLPNGRGLLFSGARTGGGFQIRQVDLAGGEQVILPTPGTATVQDVSRGGKWLFTRDDLSTRIMVRAPGAKEAQDFSWLDVSLTPALSHDGRLLALSDEGKTGGPNYTVLLRKTDALSFVRLGEGAVASFSPDDRWIAATVPSTPQKLMLYPTGTGESRRVDHGQLESYDSADWFPAGKRLLVSGTEPGKAPRCYVMPIDGSSITPVTPAGTAGGRVSPDGKWIVAQVIGGGWSLYPVNGGAARALPSITSDDGMIRWSPSGKALWVYSRQRSTVHVDSIDVSSGRRTRLETIGLLDRRGILSVHGVSLADDPQVYAYDVWPYVSHLFEAERKR